jgi:hypothetical protein
MKTSLFALGAALLLAGAGCAPAAAPVPQPPVNQPSPAPAPQPAPEPVAEDRVYGPSYKANQIVVDNIRPGDVVRSPLTITGKARGNWFFEASFPIKLVTKDNFLIANGVAQAQGEWMKTDFVPFKATLTFVTPDLNDMSGSLVFEKDNPSGLPANDDRMILPVRFDLNEVNAN